MGLKLPNYDNFRAATNTSHPAETRLMKLVYFLSFFSSWSLKSLKRANARL